MARELTIQATQEVIDGTLTVTQAALKYNIDRSTITRFIKREGLVYTKRSTPKDPVKIKQPIVVKSTRGSFDIIALSQMLVNGYSTEDIATALNTSPEQINKFMHEHGMNTFKAKKIIKDIGYRSVGGWVAGTWVPTKGVVE